MSRTTPSTSVSEGIGNMGETMAFGSERIKPSTGFYIKTFRQCPTEHIYIFSNRGYEHGDWPGATHDEGLPEIPRAHGVPSVWIWQVLVHY